MKTNQTFGKLNGINRTPFHRVHLAMSGEIVNELNAPICSVDIDEIPKAIMEGNAEMIMVCLNNHNDLLQALKNIVSKSYLRPGKHEDCHIHPELIEAARAAIAKAAL